MKITALHAHLIKWLDECGKTNIRPVLVTIEKNIWVGARYKQTCTYTASMMACTHGVTINGQRVVKKPGDTYVEEVVYCVGQRPKFKRRSCFPNAADGLDWYICAYLDDKAIAESSVTKEYHPFGLSFMLMPWNLPEKIDAYEPKPYRRVAIEIREIN